MKAILILIFCLFPWLISHGQGCEISSIPGLELWLTAESGVITDAEGKVSTWEDQSGNANHAVQDDEGLRPIFNSEGFGERPSIQFSGGNSEFMEVLDIDIEDDFTLIAVVNCQDNDGFPAQYVCGFGTDPLNGIGIPGSTGEWIFFNESILYNTPIDAREDYLTSIALVMDQSNDSAFVSFEEQQGSIIDPDPVQSNAFVVGKRSDLNWTFLGEIYDLLIFNNVLSQDTLDCIIAQLKSTENPVVDLGGDLELTSFCDTILTNDPMNFESCLWSDGGTDDTLQVFGPGQYWLQCKDSIGRIDSDTINLIYPGHYITDFTLCQFEDSLWDLGLDDSEFSFEWNTTNEGVSILIETGGEYSVLITDGSGCEFSPDTILVTLDDFPSTVSLGPDVQLCAGNCIGIVDGASEVSMLTWSTGSDVDCLEIQETDTYWVDTSNEIGCLSTDTIEVEVVGEAPIAFFGFTNTCFNDFVQFVDNSVAPAGAVIEEYTWSFGDGDMSEITDPTHQFSSVDTFLVNLSVLTDQGCTDDFELEVIIDPLPASAYTNSPLCHMQEIQFDNIGQISEGSIVNSQWTIGQEVVSGNSVIYFFDEPDSYSFQLISYSDQGCTDTITETLIVNGSPIASFDTETVCIGAPSVFTAEVDETLSGPVNQFFWDFGAGTSIFETTTFTFPGSGANEVSLTVTSALGCPDDTTTTVFVSDDPLVGFESSMACVGESVLFNDTSILFPGDDVESRTWFFANTDVSNLEQPQYTFPFPGIYDVSLDIETTAGCSGQSEGQIEVSPLPTASFVMIPNIGSPPLSPDFENFSEGASEYLWTFDFGENSFDSIPVHTFTDSGLVNVSLEVFNEAGCTDQTSLPIFLTEPLVDLVLLDVEFDSGDGFLNPVLSIRNLGNYDLEEFIIEIQVTDGPLIQEFYQGLFPRNSSLLYTMSTALYIEDELPFFCVRLIPPEQRQDQVPDNNEICKKIGLVDEEVFILSPSPNPAIDLVEFSLINLADQKLEVDVIDMTGRTLMTEQLVNDGALVQEYSLDISGLSDGRYLMRLRIGLGEEVYKLQVLKDR